jgi:type I restriction enzyme S subunit
MPDVANFVTPLPPFEEQRAIYAHIKAMLPKIDGILTQYSHQLDLLVEYRASLIHECVTGQRPVPNSSYAETQR